MALTYEHNPDVLHERLNSHARRIEILEANQSQLSDALQGIQMTLTQLKWLAIGAGVVLTAQEFGLVEAIKAVI